jgi:putative transposase
LQRHIDYIHYNPVKHGLVNAVDDWPWSTYHQFVREGHYKHKVLKDCDADIAGE